MGNKLIKAVINGDLETCRKLITRENANTDVGEYGTLLCIASSKGYIGICKLLLECGADINAKNKGTTPLVTSSGNGQLEVCKLLLEHGANVNIKDDIGETSLYTASYKGHIKVCRLLLEHGANINICVGSETPISIAFKRFHFKVYGFLLYKRNSISNV